MQKSRPFWFLLDIYAWVVLILSVLTALFIHQLWVVLLGIIGYLLALLVDLTGGRALGRTGALRLAQAEQENRELHAEQARLLGAIRELDEKHNSLSSKSNIATENQKNIQENHAGSDETIPPIEPGDAN